MRNVLVVSSVPDVAAELRETLGGDVGEVKVVAPAVKQSRLQWLTNAEDDARADAERTAEQVARATADEAEHVEAEAGDSDPLLAVEDALRTFPADEIVVVLRAGEDASWLEEGASESDRGALSRAAGEDRRSRHRVVAAPKPLERRPPRVNRIAAVLALTWYDWFKAGHVIVAVLWVGGGATLALMAIMTLRMNDPLRVAQFAHQAGKIGEWLYTPASLLVLLFGIGLMTNDQSPWDWDMTFVQIALAGWALTFLVGFFWIRPTAAKLAKTIEAKGPTDPETQAIISRILLVTRIDVLILLFIVFVMTAKPWL